MSNVKLYNCAKMVRGVHEPIGKVYIEGVPLHIAQAVIDTSAREFAANFSYCTTEISDDVPTSRAVRVTGKRGNFITGASYWIEEVQA